MIYFYWWVANNWIIVASLMAGLVAMFVGLWLVVHFNPALPPGMVQNMIPKRCYFNQPCHLYV